MSGREWKPGDVAMVTWHNEDDVEHSAVRILVARRPAMVARQWWGEGGYLDADAIDEARPLVVIDPDTIDMDTLLRALQRWHDWSSLRHEKAVVQSLLDQIEAQTGPPKPDEPQGLGAVVEDADGQTWVRFKTTEIKPWSLNAPIAERHDAQFWRDVPAVKVLSPGVTP